MELKRLSMRNRERAKDALAVTRVSQAEFWKSLGELESCLGIELDSTVDFRDANLETLLTRDN